MQREVRHAASRQDGDREPHRPGRTPVGPARGPVAVAPGAFLVVGVIARRAVRVAVASPAARPEAAAAVTAPSVARRGRVGRFAPAGGGHRSVVLGAALQGRAQTPGVGPVRPHPAVLGEATDQLHQFLDGPAGRGGPDGLLTAVRLQRRAVQQFHQPGHVLHRAALGRGPDRLVRAVRVARGPGQQADQPGDVLHRAVHADGTERVDRGLCVLGGPLQHRDEVDDLLQRPVGHGRAHQVPDGVAVLARRLVPDAAVLVVGVGIGGEGLVGEGVLHERVLFERVLGGVVLRGGFRVLLGRGWADGRGTGRR
ncbi:hypothetical protein GCM10010385_50790 [Streptomyces geysiriensis]|nr:hypothetical protein GCM10010385_50790 [Streptomyces geysiriensis]